METDILSKVRKINWILQEAPKGDFSFSELCEILSKQSDSNVYITNVNGKLLGVYYTRLQDKSEMVVDEKTGTEKFPAEYNEKLLKINKTLANVQDESLLEIFPHDENTKEKFHTFIPITSGGNRWGTMLLTRYEPAYTDEDVALAEIGATAVGLEIQRLKNIEAEEESRNEEVVKMAIRTLSYSENEAGTEDIRRTRRRRRHSRSKQDSRPFEDHEISYRERAQKTRKRRRYRIEVPRHEGHSYQGAEPQVL